MRPRVAFAAIGLALLGATPALAVSPGTRHATDPKAFGLTYEAVTFSAADSTPTAGWWFEPAKGQPIVVLAPRGSGTMADLLPAVREFQQRGFGVLTFDYRGFGPGATPDDTMKTVVFASTYVDDHLGALRYARARSGPDRHVFAWGQDMGSVVALAAAARDRKSATALAVEGVFRSTQDMLRTNGNSTVWEIVRRHQRMVNGGDEPVSAAPMVRVPMLVVLAGKDDVTPPAVTREVTSRRSFRVTYWSIPAAGHAGAEQTPGYFDKLAAFFKEWTVFPVER